MNKIRAVFGMGFAAVLANSAVNAQTVTEESIESRFQLDFHVPDAALQKFIPAGWDVTIATSGAAKDCNVRVIFIDRVSVNGPDGKVIGAGANQIVYLTVPVKNAASGAAAQMVIAGLSADAKDVPGPFGVYMQATDHKMNRATAAGKGAGIVEEQTWQFSAAGGEHVETFVKYERVPAQRNKRDTTYVSAADPKIVQVARIDNSINIARNATIDVTDRVKEFRYKIGGGRLAALFDGTEKVLSVDIFPWSNLAITPQ